MPDRLTDERLEPQIARIWATITDLAELVALRRVAEEAEALFDLLYQGHASLTEDADRAAQRMRMALAEWRRVRGE